MNFGKGTATVFRPAIVCYGGCAKGRVVSNQRLCHWIVDAIMAANTSRGLECPLHIRAHSTRAIASSWAWSRGMSIRDICAAVAVTSLVLLHIMALFHYMVWHGTVRYGSLLGGFPLGTVPGTLYFFSTTSAEVPSNPYTDVPLVDSRGADPARA